MPFPSEWRSALRITDLNAQEGSTVRMEGLSEDGGQDDRSQMDRQDRRSGCKLEIVTKIPELHFAKQKASLAGGSFWEAAERAVPAS